MPLLVCLKDTYSICRSIDFLKCDTSRENNGTVVCVGGGGGGGLRSLAGVWKSHSLYLNGSLIPGTSAHFNRLFETRSCSRAAASNQTMQNILMTTVKRE